MQLEKFGEEAAIVVSDVSSEGKKYSPLRVEVGTLDVLNYSGMLDTQALLEGQAKVLKKRVAIFLAEQLGKWANVMAQQGKLTSKKRFEHQVELNKFGGETEFRITHQSNRTGSIVIDIWLPDGIVVEPSKQLEALKEEFKTLRERLAAEFSLRCEDYIEAVSVNPTTVEISELGLDVELTID